MVTAGLGNLTLANLLGENSLLLLLGLGLVAVSVVLSIRKRRQMKQSNLPRTRDDHVEHARQMRGMRGELEDLMVDIEELARRFSAQLDAKSMRLEKLIDEADAKLAALDRRLGEMPGERFTESVAPPAPEPERRAQLGDPMAARVYQMADQGMEANDIAKTLGEHVGKVELMLALRETG